MNVTLTDNAKLQLARSFTELALQNNLIDKCEDASLTAKEVVCFFDTVFDNLGKTNSKSYFFSLADTNSASAFTISEI